MKISFIGLGAMGYPMAGHLSREHEVTVWNRTAGVAERHAKEYGTRHALALEECAHADVILTILPTGREVDEVVEVLIERLGNGTLWIDCTSGDPVTSRSTASRLAARGVRFVDAPVTGGTPGAAKGTLTVMAGGSEQDFREMEAIVKPFAAKVVHVGEIGSGHAIKAINNVMLGTHLWIAGECLVLARKFGIDPATALEVVNAGSGRSFVSESLLPSRVVEGKWPLVFKLALHDKDIRIAASMAHEQHLSTPMLALTSQIFTAALHDNPDADYIEVLKYAAALSGEKF